MKKGTTFNINLRFCFQKCNFQVKNRFNLRLYIYCDILSHLYDILSHLYHKSLEEKTFIFDRKIPNIYENNK